MIQAANVVAVLLASGRSTRFGAADKLRAEWGGISLIEHAAAPLRMLPFAARLTVMAGDVAGHPAGFALVRNAEPEAGLSHSIRLGLAVARAYEPDAVLIALADMPRVPVAHFNALLERYRNCATIVASGSEPPRPPCLFGRDWFGRLDGLRGDRGARDLLAGADQVQCDARHLVDIDTVVDFQALKNAHSA